MRRAPSKEGVGRANVHAAVQQAVAADDPAAGTLV